MKSKIATFFLVYLLLSFSVAFFAFGLTPVERKTVLHAREQLHLSINQFNAANESALAADNALVTANLRLAQLDKDIGAAHEREIALAKLNAKMKPVYDTCTSRWGLGAIGFGLSMLFKHILILLTVVALLGVALYVLSFFFPVIGVVMKAIAVFFHMIANRVHALGLHLHSNVIKKSA